MAKADYIRPVEALHGKLKKSDQVGYAKRRASGVKFTVTRDNWKQTFKDAEKAAAAHSRQMKFKGVSQSVSERMTNPTYQTIDRQGFAQQSKYTTLRGYVFRKCWDAYED